MSEQLDLQLQQGPRGSEFLRPESLLGKPSWMFSRYLLHIHPEISGMIFSVYESSDSDAKDRRGDKFEYI